MLREGGAITDILRAMLKPMIGDLSTKLVLGYACAGLSQQLQRRVDTEVGIERLDVVVPQN
jgi:hypothetical protein